MHISICVRNFGPLHDFWTFLYEHLNKVLKSYKTNNHSQGELKATFFSEFHKTSDISQIVCHLASRQHIAHTNLHQTYSLLHYPKASLLSDVTGIMLHATNKEQGMVAGLALLLQDLDKEYADGASSLTL